MTHSNTAGHILRIVLASCAHTCLCEHARTPVCIHAYTHACILVYVDRVYQKLCCAYLSVQYAHSHPRPNTYHPTNSHYKRSIQATHKCTSLVHPAVQKKEAPSPASPSKERSIFFSFAIRAHARKNKQNRITERIIMVTSLTHLNLPKGTRRTSGIP